MAGFTWLSFMAGVLVGVLLSISLYGALRRFSDVFGLRVQNSNVKRLSEFGLDVVVYEPWKFISRGSWMDMKVRSLVHLVTSGSVLIVDRESGFILGTKYESCDGGFVSRTGGDGMRELSGGKVVDFPVKGCEEIGGKK